jgi:hypothetical protein
MSTQIFILRTNRTMTRRKIPDSADDFDFEKGTYFVHKDKVFLWKVGLRGKIRPTLLYIEGIADPLYLDNLQIKEYFENLPVIDDKTKKQAIDEKGKPLFKRTQVRKITDIFIDARAIHNMVDDKILRVLSAQSDITGTEILLIALVIVGIIIGIANIFIK